MGFLAPWFLAGLVIAGLPLWLHLLRQFKRTPQPFSSLMFFERRVQSSTKHRRLRYLTLLTLRLLLLLLIVFAFANPFVNRTTRSGRRRTLTVLAIDRSFSMRAANRMAQAKAEALRMVDGIGEREMAQVLAFDSHVESLTSVQAGRGRLTAAVEAIQPTDLASSYGELARALRVLADTKGTQLRVHLFSDMQQSSMPASFRDLSLGAGTTMEVHPAGGVAGKDDASNWAVQSVNTAPRVFQTKNTKLDATIAGWQTQATTKKVSLLLDGRVIASKEVSIPANGRGAVQFLGFDVPYGSHRGNVTIEPHDVLPSDDSFSFAVERLDPRPVLFLYAGGRLRGSFYYKAALEASADTGLRVEPFAVEQLGSRDLTSYAFVVLNDLGEVDTQIALKICGYVQHGGSALIVAGPATVRAGRLPLSTTHLTASEQTQGIGSMDDQGPALAGAGHFQNVQFFGASNIAFKPSATVLAKLTDGTPLLTEERMGEGRSLVFSSTLDNTTSDFPLHASFLPFVAQTARYLSGTEEAAGSVVAGTPVALRRTAAETAAADVLGPDGKHDLPLDQATKAMSFDLLQDGFYEISRAGSTRRLVAVNADRRESDLTQVPVETLDLWRNTGGVGSAVTTGVATAEVEPVPFWRYLLVVALLAAVMESIFASRYLGKVRG